LAWYSWIFIYGLLSGGRPGG